MELVETKIISDLDPSFSDSHKLDLVLAYLIEIVSRGFRGAKRRKRRQLQLAVSIVQETGTRRFSQDLSFLFITFQMTWRDSQSCSFFSFGIITSNNCDCD